MSIQHPIYDVLIELDSRNIHYHLGSYQSDVITVHATFVGARVEIDVSAEGRIDICIFEGDEGYPLEGPEGLNTLIEKYGDSE